MDHLPHLVGQPGPSSPSSCSSRPDAWSMPDQLGQEERITLVDAVKLGDERVSRHGIGMLANEISDLLDP
jgi:hypothetical protein